MNCFRMIEGYVIHRSDPGGPVAYIGKLAPWDHVFKDTLYATQEILGDAVAVRICLLLNSCDPLPNDNSDLPNLGDLGPQLEGCRRPMFAPNRQLRYSGAL